MSQYLPIRFVDVRLEGEFWRERLDTVLTRTIPSQHAKLSEYGILESLKLPQPPPPLRFPRHANGFTVQVFWDSDVGKWIEAASYALSHRRDEAIDVDVSLQGFAGGTVVDHQVMTHRDLRATNTSGNQNNVVPQKGSGASVADGTLSLKLAPYSYQMIRVKL